jgi:peptide/nickel transport system ATP-binding protein
MTDIDSAALVELRGVTKHFTRQRTLAARVGGWLRAGSSKEIVRAVDGVDLVILPGEIMGLFGEPGCGKSTLGRLAVGLLPLTAGERYWRGIPLSGLRRESALRQQSRMQMIGSDARASLDPRMRIVDIVGKAPVARRIIGKAAMIEYVGLQLNRAGIDPTRMRQYPHEFSDAQLLRIEIARALALKPEFLVLDEPALPPDVYQSWLSRLLMDLRAALGLTVLRMSRDPDVLRGTSDRVAIMHLGRIVGIRRAA